MARHPRGPDALLPSARTPGPLLQGGCITKLETFIQEHLRIIGAVGLGIACVQVRARRGGPAGAGTQVLAATSAHAGPVLRCLA